MHYIIASMLSIVLLFDICSAEGERGLKDRTNKVSYSVGYQVGSDLKRQGIDVDLDVLLKGIQDAVSGTEPQMSHHEMRETLVNLKKRIDAAKKEEMKKKTEENLTEGKAFLAENGKKEGVKTLPSGLQYKVIKEGNGATPKVSDRVTVHYRGTLINGTEFDSSYSRNKPATFLVNGVILAWKEALQLMKEGAKWQLFIPPELGYGNKRAGKIEPNSTLIFEVELISIKTAE